MNGRERHEALVTRVQATLARTKAEAQHSREECEAIREKVACRWVRYWRYLTPGRWGDRPARLARPA
ncbi:MAG: hypothetical protein ABSG53_15450 [Thermoguttaceae bacterium]